jgi:two-component system, OmpR family, response regulator
MHYFSSVLLIEDDRNIAGALGYALRAQYELTIVTSGTAALKAAQGTPYDLIVLDLNLPDVPGLTVCQQLRSRGIHSPILILSGESQVMTKINLLDAGANDYLTKPFSLGELKARLRALHRQKILHDMSPIAAALKTSDLELDHRTYQAVREGITVPLRRKEFALLEYLMQHAGNVVSREALIRAVWHDRADVWTNTVDVHIKYLRDKIDRPFERPLIQTVHGRGYRLANSPAPIPST